MRVALQLPTWGSSGATAPLNPIILSSEVACWQHRWRFGDTEPPWWATSSFSVGPPPEHQMMNCASSVCIWWTLVDPSSDMVVVISKLLEVMVSDDPLVMRSDECQCRCLGSGVSQGHCFEDQLGVKLLLSGKQSIHQLGALMFWTWLVFTVFTVLMNYWWSLMIASGTNGFIRFSFHWSILMV